ncbi:MAG TPA: SMC-Scp complex subunit ScpB, partial [Acidimicrobiia bacterium]|nr:SMC-Scp complex subunit ScpB [Acidimicrobiia bacterium]
MSSGWRPRPVFPVRPDTAAGERTFPLAARADDVSDVRDVATDAKVDRDVEAKRAIEAVVLAATEPVEPRVLAELVELPVTRVEQLCTQLAAEYDDDRRGFVLARVAGGYRFQTHP